MNWMEARGNGRHGILETDRPRDSRSIMSSIIENVSAAPNGCIEWIGTRNNKGYGMIVVGYRCRKSSPNGAVMRRAHRVVWEIFVGDVPDGLCLDHLCRNRACVLPSHIEQVTVGENVRRGEVRFNSKPQTHCRRGHAFVDQRPIANGHRKTCRICAYAAHARYKSRRAAEKSISQENA